MCMLMRMRMCACACACVYTYTTFFIVFFLKENSKALEVFLFFSAILSYFLHFANAVYFAGTTNPTSRLLGFFKYIFSLSQSVYASGKSLERFAHKNQKAAKTNQKGKKKHLVHNFFSDLSLAFLSRKQTTGQSGVVTT